jgi:hypoxanthine phosphoribosyltransferase
MAERSMFLSEDIVLKLVKDLADKIKETYSPECLLGVGDGGMELANRFHDQFPTSKIVRYTVGKDSGLSDIKKKRVLICDDLVNSGNTLKKVCYFIQQAGPESIRTATLVLSEGAKIIPNFYCIERDYKERILLPWKKFPARSFPYGIIHRLTWDNVLNNFGREAIEVVKLIRPNEWDKYRPQAYIICDEKTGEGIGGLCFFENKADKELFITIITPMLIQGDARRKTVLSMLWGMANSYGNYHGFDKITHISLKSKRADCESSGFIWIRDLKILGQDCCEMCHKIKTGHSISED